jgi:hypothetical protein
MLHMGLRLWERATRKLTQLTLTITLTLLYLQASAPTKQNIAHNTEKLTNLRNYTHSWSNDYTYRD